MKKVIFLFVVTFFNVTVFGQSNKQNQVWLKAEALNKAVFETKDSVAINGLVAESVTYGHSTGLIEDKPTMLQNAVHNPDGYKNISFERLSAKPAGKSFIVRYILRGDQIKATETVPLNLSIIQVWGTEKGQWKLFARQAVKIAPK